MENIVEELANLYGELPNLDERIELPAIFEGKKQQIAPVKILCEHPFFTGLFTTSATLRLLLELERLPTNLEGLLQFTVSTYIFETMGIHLIKDYIFKRKGSEIILPDEEKHSLLEELKYKTLNNPKLASLLFGALTCASLYLMAPNDTLFTNYYNLTLTGTLGYAFGYTLLKFSKNNELLKRGFEEFYKKKEEPKTLLDIVKKSYNQLFEHPSIVAGLFGAGSFAYLIKNFYDSWGFGNVNWFYLISGYSVISTFVGTLAYFGTSALSWLFHSNSLSMMKDTFMTCIYSIQNRYDKAIQSWKKVMEIPTSRANESKNQIKLGDLYLKAGNVGEALKQYSEIFEHIKEEERDYTTPLDLVGSFLNKFNPMRVKDKILYNFIYPFMSDKSSKFKLFLHYVREKDYISADLQIRKLLASDQINPELHLLYAKFLDCVGDNDLASREYELVVNLILNNPELGINFQRMGESRNEVLVYDASEFLKTTLIFKKSDNIIELEEEYTSTFVLHKILKDKVVRPLSLIKQEETSFLILEHSGQETLYDKVLKGRSSFEDIIQATEDLIQIQIEGQKAWLNGEFNVENVIESDFYIGRSGIPMLNKDGEISIYFINRVKDVFLGQLKDFHGLEIKEEFTEKLKEAYTVINNLLIKAERFIYKDANLRNWVIDSLNNLTAIDFEKLRLLPPQLDLVNLFEFLPDHTTSEGIEKLIDHYISEIGIRSDWDINKRDFIKVYHAAAVHRHLELIGYRARDMVTLTSDKKAYNLREQTHHFDKVRKHLGELVAYYPEDEEIASNLENLSTIIEDVRRFLPLEERLISQKICSQKKRPLLSYISKPLYIGLTAITMIGIVTASLFAYKKSTNPTISRTRTSFVAIDENTYNPNLYILNMENLEIEEIIPITQINYSWAPNGNKIVFERGGEIFLIDFDNNEEIKLTDSSWHGIPSWSPDGNKIFAVYDANERSEKEMLVYINPELGTIGAMILEEDIDAFNPIWAPNGKELAFLSMGNVHENPDNPEGVYLCITNADASNLRKGPLMPSNPPYHIHWSPNGEMISFISNMGGNNDIYVTDRTFSYIRNVTNSEEDEFELPLWSMDSEKLFFISSLNNELNPEGDFEIFSVDSNGENIVNLTNNDTPEHSMVLSPRGDELLYLNQINVTLMNLETRGILNLTGSQSYEDIPVWSLDGNQIFYLSKEFRQEYFDLYVMDRNGENRTRLIDANSLNLQIIAWHDVFMK